MDKLNGMSNLANELRKKITASGLNRLQIAKRSGLSYSLVHRFCAGAELSVPNAERVALALGYKISLVRGKAR